MITFEANQFLMRPFVLADAEGFAAAVRESKATVGTWMSWAHEQFSEKDALAWFAWCDESRTNATAYEFGIFDDAGTLVGGAGLNQFNTLHRFCNLGYWVRESQHRRGAARAAIRELRRYAFEELKLVRAEIVIADGNEPSIATARASGAAYEGLARNRLQLHGQTVDAHVFSLVPEGR